MSAKPKDTQSPDVSPVPGVGDNQRVVIFDTTMRDGEQSPGCSMNLEEKLQVADALEHESEPDGRHEQDDPLLVHQRAQPAMVTVMI